jgi:hypothetical protein
MLFLLAAACSTPVPTTIDSLDRLQVFDTEPVSVAASVRDADDKLVQGARVQVSRTSNAAIVAMEGTGLRCVGNGSAKVTLSGEGLTKEIDVDCILVAEMVADPPALRVVRLRTDEGSKDTPFAAPAVSAVDVQGNPLGDLDIRADVDNENVVRLEADGSLMALSLGRANLTYTAGSRSVAVPIEVGQVREADMQFDVGAGGVHSVPMAPGLHLVSLTSNRLIGVRWEGADCDLPEPKIEHVDLECTFVAPGTMAIMNPGRSKASVTAVLIDLPS